MGWNYTFKEIKQALKLQLTYEQIKVWQEFENFATILSDMFGGSTSDSVEPEATKANMLNALDFFNNPK